MHNVVSILPPWKKMIPEFDIYLYNINTFPFPGFCSNTIHNQYINGNVIISTNVEDRNPFQNRSLSLVLPFWMKGFQWVVLTSLIVEMKFKSLWGTI